MWGQGTEALQEQPHSGSLSLPVVPAGHLRYRELDQALKKAKAVLEPPERVSVLIPGPLNVSVEEQEGGGP